MKRLLFISLVIAGCGDQNQRNLSAEAMNYAAGCMDGIYWLSGSVNVADTAAVKQMEGACYDMTKQKFVGK